MSKEYNLISDFDYRIIAAFFAGLDRPRPGRRHPDTPRAELHRRPAAPSPHSRHRLRHGRQTAVLASALDGPVTAVDLLPEMIEGLHRRMETEGRTEQVTGIVASMLSLPFAEASFDLLWAEGSIYNIGFEKGLTQWRQFLKPDGFIAVTECSWLSSARPDEMGFFRDNFPEIDDISGKIRCMERAGYRPVAHFILPDSCWTENYYAPAAARAREFLATYDDAPLARHFVERLEEEIEQYRRYGRRYGYVFYIGQRTE